MVGHQSIPLRPAAVNTTMTSLAPASAFILLGKQSIHLTPGSVNQVMTMSAPPSSFQTVQNEYIWVSANAAIPMSPVPPSHLQVVPNEAITVAASVTKFQLVHINSLLKFICFNVWKYSEKHCKKNIP